MKIKLFFCVTILSFLASITQGMNQKTLFFHEATGIHYTKNNFGDIFPEWQNIPQEQLTERLSAFSNLLKDDVLDSIKKAGFIFYHGNNDKAEWIFKNDSSIPEPYTASIGAAIIIKNGDSVLVVEEKTRPGILGFPGGTTDFQGSLRTTAAR